MARPAPELVDALRQTARRLEGGARYRWTHMGRCNCGHLAQTVTRLPAAEIHRRALERPGDWGEQARQVCSASGLAVDEVIGALVELGLERDDFFHLERLCDPAVLRRLPRGGRDLDHRRRLDLVRYLRAWADELEERWLRAVAVPELPTAGALVSA